MLSIEEVRQLIGDETLTEAEVTEIRDAFQILGEIIFEQWLSEREAPALQGEALKKTE
jgi:hypothetical protein